MRTSESGNGARQKRQAYRCFLIRCRLEEGAGPGGEPAWRFTVQEGEPDAGRRSFACLHDVMAHLAAQLACGSLLPDTPYGEKVTHEGGNRENR